ncbi:nucleoside 2-deoxyribosyltransferase [Pseudomonas sp. TKO26]|uniref:nucleoside 2-deoxyribosyltransferase n=1 Tax=unclassified Pseudomonas TaxID=196821 RepID=UPI000D890147|nr:MULTISPECIES: nucleoside 2-deoxyribosyltransferase [unclassified Pseudomonas]PYY81837.1 nucleoside 2-deoxyribosyltransferase [Pseudomonas sp. TKO30]PYY82956.1 nucleoside 2-deoxyribosyltransferase [Pseudomonas sp. TKO29]PYY84978.1 nucleoside 2-deoxyribosyltransferase [Pseudomonas sp. TKO26]PYY97770.1 nucleoside 2-deoxyribosyltransferase [Pseudomonas sp. TKO14]
MSPRIYLAGFDVFRADALAHGEYLKQLCSAQGLHGLFPLDNQAPQHLSPEACAQWICQQNLAMIRDSDALLANLNDFRGLEPDSGTAFEVGVAIALGKPVWAYFSGPATLRQQVSHDALGRDAQGFAVEDFNLPRNLMLACSWSGRSRTAESAIIDLGQWLSSPAPPR